MRKAIRCAWNCTAWAERVSGTSKRNETTTVDDTRRLGCICLAYLQPENLHTWQRYMIVDFLCRNRSISIDIVSSWNWSKDTLCEFERFTRGKKFDDWFSELKFTKWKMLSNSTMIWWIWLFVWGIAVSSMAILMNSTSWSLQMLSPF